MDKTKNISDTGSPLTLVRESIGVRIHQIHRSDLKAPVYRVLNEDVMILLAFLLIPVLLLPILFTFSPFIIVLFEALNYGIIAVFVAEYFLKLFVAESRIEWATNPWHLLDLFIVLLALFEFIPGLRLFVPNIPFDEGKISPVLRLIRIARVFTVAGRTVERTKPEPEPVTATPLKSGMEISTLDPASTIHRCRQQDQVCTIIPATGDAWIDMRAISEVDLDFIRTTINIPRFVLESKIIQEAFPRIDFFKGYTTIFLWDSKISGTEPHSKQFQISKTGMLIICMGNRIVTLSTGLSDLFDSVTSKGLLLESEPFPIRVLYTILKKKIADYEEIVRVIENRTVNLEEIPVSRTSPEFLEETFQLKKEIQKIVNNLWHFRQVLDHLRSNTVALKDMDEDQLKLFDTLYDESVYMYETAQNTRESLLSLIDLHINTVSYDLNRVMRVLAIITCLGVIPGIIGGLLGANLIDTPYPITLHEVMLLVGSLMIIGLYVFYKKGWLR
jgi:Mg2+ and Co2+ transporter CorA